MSRRRDATLTVVNFERPTVRPTAAQMAWLTRGLDQPGGKLPLFDPDGQRVNPRTIKACLEQAWAEPWFDNPIKPDWLVCKLTEAGRQAALAGQIDPTPDADDE